MKKWIILIPSLLMILMLSGCGCKHEWVEADCTTPKTCSLCDEVEGEPLGHTWQEATCAAPKTCELCAATEGTPLPHTPGETEVSTDYVRAVTIETQSCATCGADINSKETIISLVDGDYFCLSPEEFVARLNYIYALNGETDWNASLNVESNEESDVFNAVLQHNDVINCHISFFLKENETAPLKKDSRNVYSMLIFIDYSEIASQLNGWANADSDSRSDQILSLLGDENLFIDILKPILQTVNPHATEAEAEDFVRSAYQKTCSPFGLEDQVFQSQFGDSYVEIVNVFLVILSYMININTTSEYWINTAEIGN